MKTYVLFTYTRGRDLETGIPAGRGWVADPDTTPVTTTPKVALAAEYTSETSAAQVASNLRDRGYNVEVQSYRKR